MHKKRESRGPTALWSGPGLKALATLRFFLDMRDDGWRVESEWYATLWDTDYILGHFTGDESDLDCLVHEFGHALASRRNTRARLPFCLRTVGQEVAETHSTTMELLIWPWLDRFFSPADVKKYRRKQIEYAIYFIVSITEGDAFQHEIYDHPAMTPEERDTCYACLQRQWCPYMDLSDPPYRFASSLWQDMAVIYAQPFYMIDYALAQLLALQIYALSLRDYDEAFRRYLRFLDLSGTMDLSHLAQACGLLSPFDPACFDIAAGLWNDEAGGPLCLRKAPSRTLPERRFGHPS